MFKFKIEVRLSEELEELKKYLQSFEKKLNNFREELGNREKKYKTLKNYVEGIEKDVEETRLCSKSKH